MFSLTTKHFYPEQIEEEQVEQSDNESHISRGIGELEMPQIVSNKFRSFRLAPSLFAGHVPKFMSERI